MIYLLSALCLIQITNANRARCDPNLIGSATSRGLGSATSRGLGSATSRGLPEPILKWYEHKLDLDETVTPEKKAVIFIHHMDDAQRDRLQACLSHDPQKRELVQEHPETKKLLRHAKEQEMLPCMLRLLKLMTLDPADGLFQEVDGKQAYVARSDIPKSKTVKRFYLEDSAYIQYQNAENKYAIYAPDYAEFTCLHIRLIDVMLTEEERDILEKHCQVPDREFKFAYNHRDMRIAGFKDPDTGFCRVFTVLGKKILLHAWNKGVVDRHSITHMEQHVKEQINHGFLVTSDHFPRGRGEYERKYTEAERANLPFVQDLEEENHQLKSKVVSLEAEVERLRQLLAKK